MEQTSPPFQRWTPQRRRILEELRKRPFDDAETGDAAGLLLAQAAARIGGAEAREILREKIEALLPRQKETGPWRNLHGLVAALHAAGGEEDLMALARSLGRLLGGELKVRSLLTAAEKEPTAARLAELADAVAWTFPPRATPETLLRVLDLGLAAAENRKDKERHAAAKALVLAVVYPFNQYPVRYAFSSSWSPEFGGPPAETYSESETGEGVGGWPDPIGGARWLREEIRAGVIRITTEPPVAKSLFTEAPEERIDGRPVGEMVAFVPTREGDLLRIAVTNRASGPISVNPLAFRLATSEVVVVTEKRDGEVSTHPAVKLFLGWGWYWHESVIEADRLVVLAPGEAREFTFPLEKGLAPETRLTARFHDPFLISGPLPCPRLRTVETVPVK